MSTDDNSAALASFLWIGTIALSIGSGVVSWNWVEPENFWGFVAFLILWGILSKIAHFIMFGIIFALLDR